jgi:hypothetical protein
MQHPFNCTFGDLRLYLDLDKYLLFKSCHNLNIWCPYTAAQGIRFLYCPPETERTMRVAVLVLWIAVISTPSEASNSCLSKNEARQQFGSYIYWHGPDRCWDGTPVHRHRQIAERVQRKTEQPKWRDAMSAISRDDVPTLSNEPLSNEPLQTRLVDQPAEPEPSFMEARWVDIVQMASPALTMEKASEPMTRPLGVVLVFAFIVFAITLAIFEVLASAYYEGVTLPVALFREVYTRIKSVRRKNTLTGRFRSARLVVPIRPEISAFSAASLTMKSGSSQTVGYNEEDNFRR